MRRKFLYAFLFASLSLAVFTATTSAQRSQRLSSTPPAFQTFYAKFVDAVAKGNKTSVVALTRFPFEFAWDAGDEGTYTKAEFLKKYRDIFAGTKGLFAQKNPTFYVEGGTYSLTNEEDASHYSFKSSHGAFKFVSIFVEP